MKPHRSKTSTATVVMMAPWLCLFGIFILIPVISAMVLSFTNFNMLQMPKFVGISNYLRLLLDDDVFVIALKNTLLFAVITGPIGYLMSFVFAWSINELNPWTRSVMTLAFYSPTLCGNVYFIWKFIFDGDSNGLLNSFLTRFGLIKEPVAWLLDPAYNVNVMIVVILWMSAGTGFLTFIAGLQSMDQELYEAGALDGIRNRFQELWYITLPQMKPQLLLGAVFSISGAFSIGYQNAALTGFPSTDYSTHTILLHIQDYGYTRYEMGYASATTVVLFAMMLLCWYIFNKALARWDMD